MEKVKTYTRREFIANSAKIAGGALLLTSMGGLINACSSITTSDNKVTNLVFQTWTIEAQEVIENQIEIFKKAFPDITVTLEIKPYDDYWTGIPIAIAGGAGPDLFVMTRPNFEVFAKSDQAADITDLVAASSVLQQNFNQMNPTFIDAYKYKGRLRGIPFGVDCSGIVYNKTMIEEAGLRPISEIENDWTWDDLREYAIALTKRSGENVEQYGYFVSSGRLPLFEYLWSNGARLFNENADQCLFASEEGIEAIEFLAGMMLKDRVSPTPTFVQSQSADDLFLSGRIGIMSVGNWTMEKYRQIESFEWDVAEMPKSPRTGKRVTSSNILGYIVGPNAKDKEKTIQLIEQLTTANAQRLYAEAGIFIPARTDAQDPFFVSDQPKNILAFQRALAYAEPMKMSEWVSYPEVLKETGDAMVQILSGNIEPSIGWKQAEDRINAIIQDNIAKG